MPRDLDFYMANPEQFDGLTEDDKAKLYMGQTLEGETAAQPAETPDASAESSEAPAAADATADQPTAEANADDEPVILTRDGKHTIPFDELAKAREQAAEWERKAREAQEALDRAAKQPEAQPQQPAPPAAEKPAAIDIEALEAEAFEATLEGDKERALELRRQINAEMMRRATDEAAQRIAEKSARDQAEAAQATAQKAFDAVVKKAYEDYPHLDINSPQKNMEAIVSVKAWRDHLISEGLAPHEALSQAVEKFGPKFGEATKPQPANPQSSAEKAAAAIAKAKSGVPASLSDIPAGTSAHHDEAAALLQMDTRQLDRKFEQMTPEQIEKMLARTL